MPTPQLVVGYSDHAVTLQLGVHPPVELTPTEVGVMVDDLTASVQAGTDAVVAFATDRAVAVAPDAAYALVHSLSRALDDLLAHRQMIAEIDAPEDDQNR
ncbi:MAG: hypothetical protein HZB45_10180 [Mycolicibacterium rufum]|nr:hypothetical protein [Mycolicibacterium rufum]